MRISSSYNHTGPRLAQCERDSGAKLERRGKEMQCLRGGSGAYCSFRACCLRH